MFGDRRKHSKNYFNRSWFKLINVNPCIFSFLLFITLSFTINDRVNAERTRYNFNSGWKLYVGDLNGAQNANFDDSEWKDITLPFAWNQDEAFKEDIVDLSTDIAWYRKTFVLPKDNEIEKVFLEFEGVRHAGEFYVNGTPVGLHENGIMAVGLDVSHLMKPYPEENVVAVRTNNSWDYKERYYNQSFQWNDKNFNANYGGIPKNVYLHAAGTIYQTLPLFSSLGTTGTYVYPSRINVQEKTALINVESEVKNESQAAVEAKLEITVINLEGKEVARFEGIPRMISPQGQIELKASDRLSNLEFWSWGYGYLYTVISKVVVDGKVIDEVPIRTGFRKTAYKDGMIYLNDRVIMIKGYAQRTSNEWPAVGMSIPAWLSDYSNKLMIESNGNFVRWMHITPWKQDVESCDRVGLIQAMPAGDAERDARGRQWEQRCEVMRDAIIYNRNNPSILFYEGGNDNISENHMADLKQIRDTYDPHGGRAIGSREMLDSKVSEYGGEMLYINKSEDQPLFATEYSRDEGLRKYWDEFSPPYHKNGTGGTKGHNVSGTKVDNTFVYNRNQDSHAIENVIRWFDYWEQRPGTGKRVSSGGANIIFSDTNTHFRGAENYRRSGEVDPMRIPKDNFYAHKVMWAGWVDLDKQLTHIMGHWNYKHGTVKPIYVVSGGHKVELFVNGKSKGFGKNSYRYLYTFEDIAWETGAIKAVSFNENNEIVSEDLIKTAGEPYAVHLSKMLSPMGFKADGADMAMVEFEVVDKDGQRCPTALNEISFQLKGEAKWLGGLAKGPDNYVGATTLPVECGVNRILIRSTTNAGEIVVEASSKGLKDASVQFETLPVEVVKGLRTELVSEGLPSNLEKGPTPLTPSFVPTRRTIQIISASAGINTDKAIMSYDDNERSEWSNNGELSTGWITYELAEVSRIDEISLKMSNWRRRSYPVDILIDGKKVWSGKTKRSLGYILLPIEPTVGKTVSIQLTGAGFDKDAFADVVEVTGKKEPDGSENSANSKAEGSLKIVEVEVFQELEGL